MYRARCLTFLIVSLLTLCAWSLSRHLGTILYREIPAKRNSRRVVARGRKVAVSTVPLQTDLTFPVAMIPHARCNRFAFKRPRQRDDDLNPFAAKVGECIYARADSHSRARAIRSIIPRGKGNENLNIWIWILRQSERRNGGLYLLRYQSLHRRAFPIFRCIIILILLQENLQVTID